MSDDDTEKAREPDIKALFQNALNLSGHPFQHAVIRRAAELFDKKESLWDFVASEFPVEVQGYNTCIDFILSHRPLPRGSYGFLVAECKRANPSLKNWLFAKAPYVRRGRTSPILLLEQVKRGGTIFFPSVGTPPDLPGNNVYHIALEVKSKGETKGDPHGRRGAIEDAATQVTRGVNGIIKTLTKYPSILQDNSPPAFFLPVIFTTATLWVTDADIGKADLERGEVSLSDVTVVKKPWLWLQYPVSPMLKYSFDLAEYNIRSIHKDTLAHLLDQEFARTIAIVSSDGIDSFLWLKHWWG